MFAVLDLSEDERGITLKCDPERAIELREQHPEITPAWHFNKQYWNAVAISDNLPSELIKELIDHSYEQVVDGLNKKQREMLGRL